MSGHSIDELAALVRRGLDADELWATEASRNGKNPVVDGGEHWRWECSEHDHPVEPQPGLTEFLETGQCDCFRIGLRSVEKYPLNYGMGELEHLLFGAEEVPSAVGGHIARHDPRRVLAEVASKRALLDEALAWTHYEVDDPWYCCPALPALAGRDLAGDCNCGRDERVRAVLAHLAAPYQETT